METSEVKDVKVQAKMFLSASMNVLSKYVQVERGVESPYCNDDELRETMKTIAVMLSNAPPDLKSTIVTLIVQEEYNLITPLALFIHQQFNATVMRCIYIDFQGHPLMLAYSAINCCISRHLFKLIMSSTIPKSIIEQLRVLQCFLDAKKEHLQISALIVTLIQNLLKVGDHNTEDDLIKLGLLQVLPFYTDVLTTKFILAQVYERLPNYCQKFVVLSDSQVKSLQGALITCVANDSPQFRIEVGGIGLMLDTSEAVAYLWESSKHPLNMEKFQSSEFIGMLSLVLQCINDLDMILSSLRLLNAICMDSSSSQLLVQTNFSEILTKLEEYAFHDNEEVQVLAASTIEIIVTGTCVKTDKNADQLNVYQEEVKVQIKTCALNLLEYLLGTSSDIININDIELRYHLGRVISMLKLVVVSEAEELALIVSHCSTELKQLCLAMRDYSLWILCRDVLDAQKEQHLVPTNALALFHYTFYLLVRVGDDTSELLKRVGVLNMIVDELVSFNQLLKWNKAVGWFIQMCLATLFQPVICGVYRPERADLSDVLAYFCIHEDFEYSFPARLLYLIACPTVKKQSQLLQLTEPEMRCLILSLFQLTSTKIQKAQFRGPKGGPIISLNLNEVIMFIIRFLEMNSNNCLRFVEVDPMPVLVALFTSEDTTMKEHAVQLVLSVINHSQNHRSNMVEYLQNFLQIASIDLEITYHDIHQKESPVSSSFIHQINCWRYERIVNQTIYSMRHVMSTKDDDLENYLSETFVKARKEINYTKFAEQDRLCQELMEFMDIIESDCEGGPLLLSHFVASCLPYLTLICEFMDRCFMKILGYNDQVIIPVTTLVRLERILLIFYGFSQYSNEFCQELGRAGLIPKLSTFLYAYHALYSCGVISEVTQRLPELALFLLGACSNATGVEGYFRHGACLEIVQCFCVETLSLSTTRLLAKCTVSSLARFQDIDSKQFELSKSEIDTLIMLISNAVDDEHGESNAWPVYTLTAPHYLHYLLLLSTHLLRSKSNAKLFLEEYEFNGKSVTVIGLLSSIFQHHSDVLLLERALYFLENLCLCVNSTISVLVETMYPQLIASVRDLLKSTNSKLQEGAFFCLLSLRSNPLNTTGIPDILLDGEVMYRTERYVDCIKSLENVLECVDIDEVIQLQAKGIIGKAAFQLYNKERLGAPKKTSHVQTYYADLKTAIGGLGTLLENGIINDRNVEAEMFDVALMDFILSQEMQKKKSQVHCLLCRKHCREGEKIINSHIWANCFLHAFAESMSAPKSKKVFDNSAKSYGLLQSPGQITYPMLCQKCEDLFGKYEKAFKSKLFDVLYKDDYEYCYNPKEISINLENKINDWLYCFCLSMIFRAMGLAFGGSMRSCGNVNEVYDLFTRCRSLLLSKEPLVNVKLRPVIGLFFTPIHMMMLNESEMSPAFKSIVFSKATCIDSVFALHSGRELAHGNLEYIICSIGAIHIVASIGKNQLPLFPSECLLSPGQKTFIIPSSMRRYLLFPKGLWKTFEYLASKKAHRILHAPESRLKHQANTWAVEELESFTDDITSKMAKVDLDESINLQETLSAIRIHINLLPHPFSRVRMPMDIKNAVMLLGKSSSILFHLTTFAEDSSSKSVFVVKAPLTTGGISDNSQLCALLNIESNVYSIWTGYSLSSDDYVSIQEPLKGGQDVRLLQTVENQLNIRQAIKAQLEAALLKLGVINTSHIALWINCWCDGISPIFDLRCETPTCNYCSGLCHMCMQPATMSIQVKESRLVAQFCSSECASYFSSEIPMPIKVYKPKPESKSKVIVSITSNGSSFSLGKGKVSVQLLESDAVDEFIILYQIRYLHHQKVEFLNVSKDFQLIKLPEENINVEEKQPCTDIQQSRLLSIVSDIVNNKQKKDNIIVVSSVP